MHSTLLPAASILTTLLSTYVAADLSTFDPYTSPNGLGCVDPAGFNACFKKNTETFVDCGDVYCRGQTSQNYNDCLRNCKGTQGTANIGCWIQSCWNQVYSCEYQLTAVDYLDSNGLAQGTVAGKVPFYPPPEGASGACSCSIGYVNGNGSAGIDPNACSAAAKSGDPQTMDNCLCCANSMMLSNIVNACPKSDLSFLQIDEVVKLAQKDESAESCAVLDSKPDTCIKDFKFSFTNNKVLNPFRVSLGSEPVTNLPGNAFTDAGGETVTLSLYAYSRTLTLAQFNTKAGAVTGTATGTAAVATGSGAKTGAGTGAGTGTATGSAAKTTNSNDAGMIYKGRTWAAIPAAIALYHLV